MYKPSCYNHILQVSNGYVVYNFLYKNMVFFSFDEWDAISRLFYSPMTPFVDAALLENMFFIDSKFNEVEYFKYNYFKSLYDSSHFRNIVLPTLSCNLNCPYCYEYKRNTSMSDSCIDAYIKWLLPFLKNVRSFTLDFFGGEPLVRYDIIEKISKKVLHLQQEYGFEYQASITTNGVLMDEAVIRGFDILHIDSVQVSFDGDKYWHDQYRRNQSGGSFNVLFENTELYCSISQSLLPMFIRVNVTDANFQSIPNLLDRFSERVKKRSIVFFRWIYENAATNYRPFSQVLRGDKPFENLAVLYQIAQEKGFYTNNLTEEPSYNYCECDFANFFTIDPEGFIYQCSHSYRAHEAIGSVYDDEMDLGKMNTYFSVINSNPFDDQDCMVCKLLPMCKGGCRIARSEGKKICIDSRDSVDEYVRMIYNKKRR